MQVGPSLDYRWIPPFSVTFKALLSNRLFGTVDSLATMSRCFVKITDSIIQRSFLNLFRYVPLSGIIYLSNGTPLAVKQLAFLLTTNLCSGFHLLLLLLPETVLISGFGII
jgi:hypothetical protein